MTVGHEDSVQYRKWKKKKKKNCFLVAAILISISKTIIT